MNRHFTNCDADECLVCESYVEELREWVLPLYYEVLLQKRRRDDDQTTITEY